MKIIFSGNETVAYRDPACIYIDGRYYLFMTVSEKRGDYMYNRIGLAVSDDSEHWSEIKCITDYDLDLNFSSPGNILSVAGGYRLFICSYPMPQKWTDKSYATDDARLYFTDTADFIHFTEPKLLNPKGGESPDKIGRMIDPYVFPDMYDNKLYHLFFKQNGVSHSVSEDLIHWEYKGHMDGGENACIICKDGKYHLFHSPENGIGHKITKDLISWEDKGITTLGQSQWKWASGRLTAGFVMECPEGCPHRYIMFFHGSVKEAVPETHGAASIALAHSDDLENFF